MLVLLGRVSVPKQLLGLPLLLCKNLQLEECEAVPPSSEAVRTQEVSEPGDLNSETCLTIKPTCCSAPLSRQVTLKTSVEKVALKPNQASAPKR